MHFFKLRLALVGVLASTCILAQTDNSLGDDIDGVELSPDGKKLVSHSQDGAVLLWGVQTGQLSSTLSPANEVISQRRVSNRSLEDELKGWAAAISRPQVVGFSSDGSQIFASAGQVKLPANLPKTKDEVKAKPIPARSSVSGTPRSASSAA
jgi:WD40 repeat protein